MSSNPRREKYDFILAGGGLQAGLLATAIDHYLPSATVLLIERDDRLCGNHTWSFHASDVSDAGFEWLSSLPITTWPGYWVKFNGFKRKLNLAYCSLPSSKLEKRLLEISQNGRLEIKTRCQITRLDAHSLETSDGITYRAETLVDCRGLRSTDGASRSGFQTFHGFEVELEQQDWPDALPIVMDATVDQQHGFRFLYVLPMSNRNVLIEDTHFSEDRALDRDDSLDQVARYLDQRGVTGWKIIREEHGCLPMTYSNGMKPQFQSPLRGGYAGGWFHAATGYSFPLAARFAETIASSTTRDIPQRISLLAAANRFQASYARFLNRLLFRLVSPSKRWMIFRRFYRVLPETTIRRFYAHQFTKLDAARIVVGSPLQGLTLGLTPFRFLQSFKGTRCPVIQD